MNYRSLLLAAREGRKAVLVAGLGISGIEAALAFRRMGLPVIATERASREEFLGSNKYRERIAEVESAGAVVSFDFQPEQVEGLPGIVLAVLSPGISPASELGQALKRRGVPIVTELEVACSLLETPAVFVTGTNGKSTVTSLVAALLEAGGRRVRLCGNIGEPVIAGLEARDLEAPSDRWDVLAIEISSYQIELSPSVTPKVGVFLNISENHLERHGTLDRYLEVKSSLFRRQKPGDSFVFNADDARVAALAPHLAADSFGFGMGPSASAPAARIDYAPSVGRDTIEITRDGQVYRFPTGDARLIGRHNRYNMAAAALVALLLGVPGNIVGETLLRFAPLEHRIEQLQLGGERLVFNDSKSTTPLATAAALSALLEQYPARPVSLCIGGKLKRGGDIEAEWSCVFDLVQSHPGIHLVCFGGDGALLSELAAQRGISSTVMSGVAELCAGLQTLPIRQLVLFSPGAASFDEFSDFEHRGNVFKSTMRKL